MKKFLLAVLLISLPYSALADTATIGIRSGNTLVGPYTVTLPDVSDPPVPLAPTGTTTTYAIPARSVLALLTTLDATTTDFAITDLQYFSSFNSFLLNCVSVPAASSAPDCFNWTYAVNGSFPFVGMDAQTLHDGDIAYVIFGSQWQVSTNKSSALTGESFTVTAETYNPATGLYVPAVGEVVGAVQFDSNFIATEFATSTTDASGSATLSLPSAGSYVVGIASSNYFPNATITISVPPTPAPSGGGGASISHAQLNVSSALHFLTQQQSADGSFATPLLSDWAALAFAASDPGEAKIKLRAYLLTASPTLSSVTDYVRHAMALLALGINPYTGTATDYIAPIVNAFDGTQIGDPHLDNDDVFALFPLLHAGYTASDDIIKKTVAFILSAQNPSGAWDGSVDMTAATIQALALVQSLPGVSDALVRAEHYIRLQQQSTGGFENSFSTSWVLQALAALNQSVLAWTKNDLNPNDSLASLQQTDGGIEAVSRDTLTRTWATAYAIPAALEKTWHSLLHSFERPLPQASGAGATNSATTALDNTVEHKQVATTTPPIQTMTEIKPVRPQAVGTTVKTPLVPKQIGPKPVSPTVRVVPPPASSLGVLPVLDQVAAVATAPERHLFKRMWEALFSFWSKLM